MPCSKPVMLFTGFRGGGSLLSSPGIGGSSSSGGSSPICSAERSRSSRMRNMDAVSDSQPSELLRLGTMSGSGRPLIGSLLIFSVFSTYCKVMGEASSRSQTWLSSPPLSESSLMMCSKTSAKSALISWLRALANEASLASCNRVLNVSPRTLAVATLLLPVGSATMGLKSSIMASSSGAQESGTLCGGRCRMATSAPATPMTAKSKASSTTSAAAVPWTISRTASRQADKKVRMTILHMPAL
mmetsp:Transcript_84313/g.196018  ORF Transcript_84313/g.196018 Transcript_84313/m.196018 type:complete len:243 (-) Transcript_84313:277-1005(-)